jgi:hypothetical protein
MFSNDLASLVWKSTNYHDQTRTLDSMWFLEYKEIISLKGWPRNYIKYISYYSIITCVEYN